VYALTGGLAPLMPAIEASQLKKKTPPLEKVLLLLLALFSFYFCFGNAQLV